VKNHFLFLTLFFTLTNFSQTLTCRGKKNHSMSSVFIVNVDDYLAPSQACVNPKFIGNVEEKDDKKDGDHQILTKTKQVSRSRRKQILQGSNVDAKPMEIAKVSITDCLACSGCITSAETVLVEQHSLKSLQEKLSLPSIQTVVVTVSPASWADALRHLQLSEISLVKEKLTTLLNRLCNASIVLDGWAPLQWSLNEAAHEFCHVYSCNSSAFASTSASSSITPFTENKSQIPQDRTLMNDSTKNETTLPLLSSSCPAVVCLIEKNHHSAIQHLATTKSPLAMAGLIMGSDASCFHIGIMPCHDKKLEASRMDFVRNEIPDIDMVITTQEWIDWISQSCQSSKIEDIRKYVLSMEPAALLSSLQDDRGKHKVVIISDNSKSGSSSEDTHDDVFFAHSSGGYADYIFRYAARTLFGYSLKGHLDWKPVKAEGRVSARVAASRSKSYFLVTLYKLTNGSYSMMFEDGATPILRFATAYGVQTLKRVLKPLEDNGQLPFDYVEIMACPSGCLNGGGQIRSANRETTQETHQRVLEAQGIMKTFTPSTIDSMNDDIYDLVCPSGPFQAEAKLHMHTNYHAVTPFQHSKGAVAGVAVQDTQW
jgi:iron only hydrogenase large subunit-like protein